MPSSPLVEDYRRKSAECLRLSHEYSDPTSKVLFLRMAQEWLMLAERYAVGELQAPGPNETD
jgi:hypothetical protein